VADARDRIALAIGAVIVFLAVIGVTTIIEWLR
jgi:hypothetical protein